MRRPGIGCISFALLLLLPVLPASATAANANVFHEGVDTIYNGSDSVDHVSVGVTAAEPPKWLFKRVAGGALMTAGSECTDALADGTEILCAISGGVKFTLEGGDDQVIGGADGQGLAIAAGPGEDELTICCSAQNLIEGGEGDDTIVDGAINRDTIDGGPGADIFVGPKGPDLINGGTGTDTVVYQNEPGDVFTVTLDDDENDGPSNSENVHSDVENLFGGQENDRFVGSAATNVLRGGQGNDEIDGGTGRDTIDGGEDEDKIYAVDGENDTVDCGFGDDSATVDGIDTVVKCERVKTLDGVVAVNVLPITPFSSPTGPSGTLAARKALIRNGSGSASFRCRAPAGDTCSVRGNLLRKGKNTKVGSVAGSVGGGKTGPLKVRLNASGRRLLEEAGKLSATIKATITNEAGATAPLNSALRLKPAPKPKQA